jgi:hypothetical protein
LPTGLGVVAGFNSEVTKTLLAVVSSTLLEVCQRLLLLGFLAHVTVLKQIQKIGLKFSVIQAILKWKKNFQGKKISSEIGLREKQRSHSRFLVRWTLLQELLCSGLVGSTSTVVQQRQCTIPATTVCAKSL